jgi:CRISPR-associated protein Csm2
MSRQCSGCENNGSCSKLEDFQVLKDEFSEKLGGRDDKLSDKLDAESLVLYSCSLGRHLAKVNLKTSQIRRFLDAFRDRNSSLRRREEDNAREQSFLLEPRLAYAAGRQPRQVQPLFEMLKPAMDRVKDKKDFDRLTRFLESVVAYHRYHGGSE